nr:uncharacterized protein CI109_005946 [Kwoniella shandongensis]KAA5525638.1 hypothetical protein CI109_005946 [Kwoniella shandongensis]
MLAEKGYTSIEIDITAPASSSSETAPLEITQLSSSSSTPTFPDPDRASASSSEAEVISPFPSMVTALNSQIRLMAIPFPPIIIARGGSTLLAQAYIEDHPASGLVLLDPTADDDPRSSSASNTSEKGQTWKWPVFKYEPHFPLLILSSQEKMTKLSVENRLVREFAGEDPNKSGWTLGRRGRGKGVELAVVDESRELSDKGRIEVERWMDRCGF